MDQAQRVVRRFFRSQDTSSAIDRLCDELVDHFLDSLARKSQFDENDIAHMLEDQGLHADHVNALDQSKQAGPMIKALGGLIKQGLWYLTVRPFLTIRKLLSSPQFRQDIKNAFRKALSHELRATRHLGRVVEKLALGEEVSPQEKSAAMKHLAGLLVQAIAIYFTGSQVTSLFAGGVWPALSKLTAPAGELVLILLRNPIGSAVKQLLASER